MALIVATTYTVYPTGFDVGNTDHVMNVHSWTFTIEQREPGRWAICRYGRCMNRRGGWSYESQPSSRTDRFKAAYRFPLEEAQALALRYIDRFTIQGLTWPEVLERWKSMDAAPVTS